MLALLAVVNKAAPLRRSWPRGVLVHSHSPGASLH